ncbi:MAG: XdhC family protein [Hyphomicrobiales bacterium]|nr:XdhC family protein [Hyphomicrobiales bacterium]MCP5372723.1 XdhC family protein [Hyphomicrobiales bacterium]
MAATSGDGDDALARALAWVDEGRAVAIATVVNTWGSSPRPPGSLLAVSGDGAFFGSVSGGCIETDVVEKAQAVIAGGRPLLLDYGVSDKQAWDVGLACGGEIRVFVERLDDPAMWRGLRDRRPAALVTDLVAGRHAVLRPGAAADGDLAPAADTLTQAREALLRDRSTPLDDPAGPVFVRTFNPPLRMFIVGAVHIAQELAPMAARAGFAVTVADPRDSYATEERFPGVHVVRGLPDGILEQMAPDHRTAVVALSHNTMFDDPALLVALDSDAFYIGALGSRRTHAKRLDRLRVSVEDESALGRIHAPIGLDLGGREAAEVAVAILAEVIAARHGKDARAADDLRAIA